MPQCNPIWNSVRLGLCLQEVFVETVPMPVVLGKVLSWGTQIQ